MGREIERKFLVRGDAWRAGAEARELRQGYLCTDPDRTVRVRLDDGRGVLTIKGRAVGLERAEYEVELPPAEAAELLDRLCLRPLIEKTRHHVRHAGHLWEVDEFHGENAGLVLAEVELERADEAVTLPAWVGAEVSHDPRYSNSRLSREPWGRWGHRDDG